MTLANRMFFTVLAVMIAGCGDYDDSDSHDSYERDRRDERISDPRYEDDYDRDRDRYTERERERERERNRERDRVPRGAVVIGEGAGKTLRHDPAHPGRAYLYDMDDEYVVYETRLRPGERLAIDPEKDSIKVDGVKDAKVNLRAKHRYRLYYLRDDKATDRRGERF